MIQEIKLSSHDYMTSVDVNIENKDVEVKQEELLQAVLKLASIVRFCEKAEIVIKTKD